MSCSSCGVVQPAGGTGREEGYKRGREEGYKTGRGDRKRDEVSKRREERSERDR